MKLMVLFTLLIIPNISNACLIKLTLFDPNTNANRSAVYFEKNEIISISQVSFVYLYTAVCGYNNCIRVHESPEAVQNITCSK